MKLEDQVCSPKLAKRLDELGCPQDSLWYWQIRTPRLDPMKGDESIQLVSRDYKELEDWEHYKYEYYSAFTVAELERELLTIASEYDFMIRFSPTGGVWDDEVFDEMYEATLICHKDSELDIMERAGTGADVRAKLIDYLKENKLIAV